MDFFKKKDKVEHGKRKWKKYMDVRLSHFDVGGYLPDEDVELWLQRLRW
jgi:hypothetical protein